MCSCVFYCGFLPHSKTPPLSPADSEQPLVIKEEDCCSVVFKEQLEYTHIKEEEEEFCIQKEGADSTAIMLKIKKEESQDSKHLSKSHTQESWENCGRSEQARDSYRNIEAEVSCSRFGKTSKEHENNNTEEKSCSCMDCGQRFIKHEKQEYCTRIIKKRTRKRNGTNSLGRKSFSCSECGKNFTQKSSLRTHKKIHTGEKPFSCSECGRRFIRKSDLKRHGTTHPGEKPFCCNVCGKRFTLKSDLKRHGSSHPGDKPFSCSECGKGFTLMSSLRSHERIHTGEKPFSCSVCGKGFTLKSDLKRHEIIHTGEKPFSCSECGKKFTQKSSLKTHEKIHSSNVATGVVGLCLWSEKNNLPKRLVGSEGEAAMSKWAWWPFLNTIKA
uniref:Gastrula zinc finger protein XlCGF57.1-like n=1 Tax=Cynoglossus semilaevis TaxID=244447 RepID=A0A3P8WJV5_CYNSE